MTRISRAMTVVLWLVLAALAVAFVGVRLFGLTPYAVLSGSMEPEYPVGSLIYVTDVDPATIQPGDNVTFHTSSGQIATHQAYEVDAETRQIRTQGIANINVDGTIMHDAEPVPFSQVIGKPVACIPWLGYVNSFTASTPGRVVVIAVVIGAFILPSFTRRSTPRHGASRRGE